MLTYGGTPPPAQLSLQVVTGQIPTRCTSLVQARFCTIRLASSTCKAVDPLICVLKIVLILSTIVLEMRTPLTSVGDLLFGQSRGRVLALLYGAPDKSFFVRQSPHSA